MALNSTSPDVRQRIHSLAVYRSLLLLLSLPATGIAMVVYHTVAGFFQMHLVERLQGRTVLALLTRWTARRLGEVSVLPYRVDGG